MVRLGKRALCASTHNGPDTDIQFPLDEEWVRQDDQEQRRAFVRKVDRCWKTLQESISDYTPKELLDCAQKLEAARASYIVLKSQNLPLECIRYLTRFKDPLRVTYEEWLADSRNDPSECILETLYDTMEGSEPAERRYELEG